MNKSTYKEWVNSTNKLLDNCRKFRKLCGKPFDRGFIGELLLIKKLLEVYGNDLCRNKDNKIIYLGNANKGYDAELKVNGKSAQFDAKATTTLSPEGEPRWVRGKARVFCDVEIDQVKRQKITLKTDFNPHMFYVYINIDAWLKNNEADYYILSDKKVKSTFGKKYQKIYDGRIRESGSTEFWVEYKDVKKFKDNKFRSTKKYFSKRKLKK